MRNSLATAVLLCAASLSLYGQQTTATVVGTVTDTSGAVISGVTVRATNLATNAAREGKSDASGSYSIPFLVAGDYTINATLAGFQAQKVDRLTLQVDQTARLDLKLQVGNVSESVEVNASAASLQTENATVGTVIDSAKIVELPLNGRNFIQLAQLVPGVQSGTPGSITVRRGRGSVGQTDQSYGATAASANGQRDTANRYLLDGIEVMDYDAVTYSFSPSVDALAEFKVDTSGYSAEAGSAPGGQIAMMTKSGSNALRGTLWEFNRNDALSQTYDAIAGVSAPNPRLNRNQFGANIGGPVVLPKIYHGKDKTFFFFNWESGYAAQGALPTPKTIIPAAVRTGDFSAVKNAKTGAPIPIIDPFTGTPFAGNIIPSTRLSQQALVFLTFNPLPNQPNNVYLNPPASAVAYQRNYTTRIDHNFSTRDTLSGRYLFNDTYEAGIPYWGHDTRNNLGRTQGVEGNWTHTFGPSLINQFRSGWHHFGEGEVFGTTNDPNYDVVGKMNLPGASRLPVEFGPPSISISGPDGAYSVYDLARQIGPRTRSNGITQFMDTLSCQRGTHFFKIGTEIDDRLVTFQQARAPRGAIGFTGIYTGSALADFMLGYVQNANLNPTHTNTDLHDWTQAYYLQDDWKATSRLTINLGLRYDYFAPYTQSDNKFADVYQNGYTIGGIVTPQNSPYGAGLLQPNRGDFAPRIGLAYRPSFAGESVIRAGYGIYWTSEISNAIFAMAEGAQATSGASVTGNPSGVPNILFSNPFGAGSSGPAGTLPFAVSNDQNLKDTYAQQWNLNIQHKFAGNFLVDAGYVGAKDTHLIVTFGDLNRPIQIVCPNVAACGASAVTSNPNTRRPNQLFPRSVTGDKSTGNASYNALQLKLERRMTGGVTLLTAYTWSKSMSGPSDIGGQVGGGQFIGAPQDVFNGTLDRSISGFDVTQRFVQTILYDVPFFKHMRGPGRYVLDGWEVSSIMTAQSGFPAAVTLNVDTTGTGINSRPDQIASGNLDSSQRTWKKWFNTAAFVQAPFGRFGDSPRTGAFRLPGVFNVDFSATKAFRVTERRNLQLRMEAFNLFNHYNPDPYTVDLAVNSATFGTVGLGLHGYTTRVIQLGAKLNF